MATRHYVFTALVLAVIIYVYISLYRRPCAQFDIVQCSIESITPAILAERQLVIINEPIIAPESLLETLFAWQYIWCQNTFVEPVGWSRALAKYTVITSPFWDIEIDIATPDQVGAGTDDKKYVKIQLSKHQIVIVPPLWFYRSNKKIKYIALDDIISKLAYAGMR